MKTTLAGLIAAIIIGAIGLIVLRSMGVIKLPSRVASPSPSASVQPNFDIAPLESALPSSSPVESPEPSVIPTTKGGLTLGETYPTVKPSAKPIARTTTSTSTQTTTKTVTTLRVFETSSCPVDGKAEIRDISSDLTFKYSLKDGYSAKVTIWKMNGETVLPQTQISGQGILKTVTSRDDLKLQIVSHECSATSDTWIKLSAEK